MKKIKYISFYNHLNSDFNRVSALSAVNKINYIVETLNELNYEVEIVSPSWLTSNNNVNFVGSRKNKIGRNTYVYSPSLKPIMKVCSIINIILTASWLVGYLMINCKKNEKLIVYHSPLLLIPILVVSKLK